MSARTLMTPNPAVVTGEDSIRHAAQVMRDRDVGMVPVVDDRAHMHLRGVITDRDIAIRCAAEHHGGECRVENHMTRGNLDTVSTDTSAGEVIQLMERDQVRRVMVTEGGRLVGVIAQADLALKAGPLEPLRVEAMLERLSAPRMKDSGRSSRSSTMPSAATPRWMPTRSSSRPPTAG
jgi:CBS domain-containing protein